LRAALLLIFFEVYFFVICAGVFPQKTPEQSMKIFRYCFDFV